MVSGMSNSPDIGYIILAVLGLGFALFFKDKAKKEEAEAIISETQAKDAPLVAQQAQDEAQMKVVDKGLQDMLAEREKLRKQYVTDQQKADSWNKPDGNK